MPTVGYATLDVIPSMKGLRSQLEKQSAGDLAAAGRTGGRRFGDAAGKEAGGRFKGGFASSLKGFAPFAGLIGGAAIGALFKDAIEGASDLQESGTKLEAIFGDAYSEITSYASTAGKSLGQTRVQAMDAAATFGTFGKAAGLAGSDLAGFSTEMVGLSTDLASFFNTDVDTAISAIGSGLRGEAEPLRQFGVLLDDATLRQEALKQGLIATTKQALTPQQKVLAAHAVILAQTADAQGDFEKTSDGLANQQRILAAQWAEMKTTVGEELLPAMTGFVSFLSGEALPALGEAGGMAKDAASAFGELPGPVKATAAAFVALRIASATGLASTAATGVASLSSSMTGLRIRTMLATDAFRQARGGLLTFTGNTGQYIMPVGRLSASLQGLRAGAAGAGAALKSGLGSAMSLLGGPWGVAMIAGTALLTKFWREHQEAKQHVEDLTASLDKQTGAITRNTKEEVANALQKSGVIDLARKWGVELDDLTRAAMGNTSAQGRVNEAMNAYFRASKPAGDVTAQNAQGYQTLNTEAGKLRAVIGGQNGAVSEATQKWRDHAELMGKAADATDRTARATGDSSDALSTYARRIDSARDAILDLWAAENKRRLAAVQDKRDRLGLIATMQAARKEAREGKKTLDENTEAGQENWQALLDLADQWNTSTGKVRNAKGAYAEMRQTFIDVAKSMDPNIKNVEKLADRYLTLPKTKRTEITTPGMEKALEDLREYRLLARNMKIRAEVAPLTVRGQAVDGFASGGKVGGYGTGDKRLILADPREWVMNPQASAYYGDGFMAALNRMQIPRFAAGGPVSPTRTAAAPRGGNTYNVTVVADDPWKFKRDTEHMARTEAIGGHDFRTGDH